MVLRSELSSEGSGDYLNIAFGKEASKNKIIYINNYIVVFRFHAMYKTTKTLLLFLFVFTTHNRNLSDERTRDFVMSELWRKRRLFGTYYRKKRREFTVKAGETNGNLFVKSA